MSNHRICGARAGDVALVRAGRGRATLLGAALGAVLAITSASAQTAQRLPEVRNDNPFPPLEAKEGVITVTLREFATLPDVDGIAARAMTLVEEPGAKRLFVSDNRGLIWAVSPDGRRVTQYLDLRAEPWNMAVEASNRSRGVQSIVFHPQFAERGAPGAGKFYTYADVALDQNATVDYMSPTGTGINDTVIHEWTARTPGAATYDGAAPREVMRWRARYANHHGGMLAFNPLTRPGAPDYGLMYVGAGDGGSFGDPMNLSQNLSQGFGKLLRIDPLGRNAKGGRFGVPASNPFVGIPGVLPEIWAYGIRNTQRYGWDSKDGAMYLSDIGEEISEEVSPVSAGANLGWNLWEGSYRFLSPTAVDTSAPRSDPRITYPLVEWDQNDPLMLPSGLSASVGMIVVRNNRVPQLKGRMLFGDMPSGEMFHIDADNLPKGGSSSIRRVLFVTGPSQTPRTLLTIVQEKNRAQGRTTLAERADMRFDPDSSGRIFVLNKGDGIVRVIER